MVWVIEKGFVWYAKCNNGLMVFDINGKPVSGEAEGFHARLLQHECDHLDGRLYPTRILHTASFGFKKEIQMARDWVFYSYTNAQFCN